jgi:hypothetical protein
MIFVVYLIPRFIMFMFLILSLLSVIIRYKAIASECIRVENYTYYNIRDEIIYIEVTYTIKFIDRNKC